MESGRPTTQFMVEEVTGWLRSAPAAIRKDFVGAKRKDLPAYHHTLGQKIRNHFGLWQHEWTPHLIDAVDHATEHPDNISGRVIEAVWEGANNRSFL